MSAIEVLCNCSLSDDLSPCVPVTRTTTYMVTAVLVTALQNSGTSISTIYPPSTHHLPTTYPPSIHHLSTIYPPSIHHLLTTYPPSTHHLSTIYPPSIHHLSTTYPPSIHHLPTIQSFKSALAAPVRLIVFVRRFMTLSILTVCFPIPLCVFAFIFYICKLFLLPFFTFCPCLILS